MVFPVRRRTSSRPALTLVWRCFFATAFLTSAALFITAGARASVLQVAPGAVTGSSSGCSLTDAIKAANQSTTANTTVGACTPTGAPNGGGAGYSHGNVILLAAGHYIFTAPDNFWYGPNALPPIATDIVIVGAPGGSFIERNTVAGTSPFRLFYVGGGQSLADYNAPNVPSGKLPGPGSLTLVTLTVRNGLAKGGDSKFGGGGLGAGGAIYNQGMLRLYGVTLAENTAWGGSGGNGTDAYGGGGIGGDATISDLGHNTTGGGFTTAPWPDSSAAPGTFGNGGCGYATAPCSNTSDVGVGGGGGGADALGGSGGFGGGGGSFGGGNGGANGGFGGGGGGDGGGGGSGLGGGSGGFGGGSGNNSLGGGGAGLGGAVFNEGGSVAMLNSTLADNAAHGGSAGSGSGQGTPGSGYGGALFNLNGTVTIRYSTLSGNTVEGSENKGGAVYSLYLATPGSPAADAGAAAAMTVTASILAGSTDGSGAAATDCENVKGSLTSGHDVAQMPGSCTFSGLGDQTADPQLAPGPAANGGPTRTLALKPISPAIQMGKPAGAPATDQRGYVRDAVPDTGAFEYGAAAPAIGVHGLTNATVAEGQPAPTQSFGLSDNAGGSLTLSFTSSNAKLLPVSGISTNADCGSDSSHYACTLSLAPTAGAVGSTYVTINATDSNGYSGHGSFTLTINQPSAPVANDLTLSVYTGESIQAGLPASDPNHNTLTWHIVTKPAHGQLSLDTKTGVFTYAPDAQYTGQDQFTFTANNGQADSNTATVRINVLAARTEAVVQHDGDSNTGGGGASGWWALMLLASLTLARAKTRAVFPRPVE